MIFIKLFFCFLTFFKIIDANNSYLVAIPYKWLFSFDQTIAVSFYEKNIRNIDIVTYIVKNDDLNVNFSVSRSFNTTKLALIKFKLPEYFPPGTYNVTIEGKSDDGFYFRNSTNEVIYKKINDGVYILTDKPIYKPSEKILIRIVGINGALLPVNETNTVTVQIYDPNHNRVKQYNNLAFNKGFIDDLFLELSDRSMLGEWKIDVVKSEEQTVIAYAYFTVQEYVLKKFDINIDVPKYVLKRDNYLEGTIEAKYTYGKYVIGEALIDLKISLPYYYFRNDNEDENYEVKRILKVGEEKTRFKLPIALVDSYSIKLNVTVTEAVSGISQNKLVTVDVFDAGLLATIEPKNFVPNNTNNFSLTLNNPQYRPLPNKKIKIDYLFVVGPLYDLPDEVSLNVTSGDDGVAKFSINVPINVLSITFKISLFDSIDIVKLILFKSPERKTEIDKFKFDQYEFEPLGIVKLNSLARLELKNKKINFRNQTLKCQEVHYLVVSRSMILNSGFTKFCNTQDKTTGQISFYATILHSPVSKVILYYLNDDNYLNVQTEEIKVDRMYLNQVTLRFDTNKAEPGDLVKLSIKTEPFSKAHVSVIDQSVLLMKKPNELTNDLIENQIDNYQLSFFSQNFVIRRDVALNGYWGMPEPIKKFNDNGFIILTDLSTLSVVFKEYSPIAYQFSDKGSFLGSQNSNLVTIEKPTSTLAAVDRIRKDFRETWIWSLVDIDETGVATIDSLIPDTITSWVASGLALNNIYGLGIADYANVTAFKGFFVTLNLPAAITRGEFLVLQVVVSNYLNVDLENVLVTLVKPAGFKRIVALSINNTQLEDINEDIQLTIPFIKSQVGKSVSFAITPTKLGLLDLTVKAQSAMAADAESRKLLVKAEGIPETKNILYFFELDTNNVMQKESKEQQVKTSMKSLLPDNRVSESEYCEIQVIGDLLGSAFNNLDKLLNRPTGCGEQNMLYLTPNIYALKYLSRKPKARPKSLIEKARRNIQIGYENQLKYKRRDGSFSAFGDIDKNGSSWLTAFVVKSFTQAREFIDIDLNVLDEATDWLLKQQNIDGSFNEPGVIISSNIQGGVHGTITNTAYITISLLESNLSNPKILGPIEYAINYLETNLRNIEDPYTLSLLSYAFSLVNSFKSGVAFRKLNSLADTTTSGYKFWKEQNETIITKGIWTYKKSSIDIEITSYALLSSMRESDISKSIEIVRWLVNQSSSLGGYSSTQNTVLALQALTTFALKTSLNLVTDSQLIVRIENNNEDLKVFNITEENSLVLQSMQFKTCPNIIEIEGKGSGQLFIQLIATYNLPTLDETPVFELNQTVNQEYSINNLELKTCVRYIKPNEKTGMSIVEAYLFNGFTVNKNDLNALVNKNEVKDLKLIEYLQNENKVVFYFDQLDNQERCILWNIERLYLIAASKPVIVRAYDYYKPELEVTILFSALSNVSICNVNKNMDNC